MKPAVPAMVRFVKQSGHHSDCGVATLAMLAGVLYEDALATIACEQPGVLTLGLTWHELRRAAKALGLKTRITKKYDPDEDTGILNVGNRKVEHFVFLWEGRVVEGNGELWLDVDAYLKHNEFRARALLKAVE